MSKQHWQDWINVLLGAWVFVSPWFLAHAMSPEASGTATMWNLWTVGAAVVVFAGVALYAFNAWEEWVNVALGAWLLVSPWLLGFSASAALMWNAVIVGVLVIVFAGWALTEEGGPKQLAH